MTTRKCRQCTRPAAFLSALCEACQASHRKAVSKYAGRKRVVELRKRQAIWNCKPYFAPKVQPVDKLNPPVHDGPQQQEPKL